MVHKVMRDLRDDERGVALVTAMLVSMVVVVLGATSVTLAIHNTEQSAYDRRRVQNVAAAEAGLNYYYSHIQSEPSSNLLCSISKNLGTTPVTTFTATATYYDSSGTALACSGNKIPAGATPVNAHVRSVGTTVGNTTPTRVMETYMRLTPLTGGSFGNEVVFSNNSFNWAANVSIRGDEASNNNVYTNGTASFNSRTTVYGSVYAQGGINLRGNAQVRRDVWANGAVSLSNNSSVLGNATSSTSSVSTSNAAKVYGNATAGTTINGSGVLGTKTPNSPQGPPPVRTLPVYTFNAATWAAEGYQIATFGSCSPASSFITGITGGSWVVRITGGNGADCLLSGSFNVRGNLAIFSDGGFSGGRFTAVGGPWNLYLFMGQDGVGSPCDITFGPPRGGSGPNLLTLLHTPCAVNFRSNTGITSGQIYANSVTFASNSGIAYAPVPVPGLAGSGFKEDILYIREVVP